MPKSGHAARSAQTESFSRPHFVFVPARATGKKANGASFVDDAGTARYGVICSGGRVGCVVEFKECSRPKAVSKVAGYIL
jgi:hypothetical protein